MNLDKGHRQESTDWLAPAEWTMEIQQEEDQSIIVVKRSGMQMCRLSVAPVDGDEAAVRHALANKARHWIRDFLSRAAD